MVWLQGLPPAVWVLGCGLLGLIVGSFLNVVILRLPARLLHDWRAQAHEMLELTDTEPTPPGIVREPSHCPQCKHPLSARDNIPLFSWLLLAGRCRYCKTPISVQYPLVELLTALAAATVAWHFGPGLPALAGLALTFLLVAMAGIDARTQLLPDSLTLPLLWLGLLLSLLPVFVHPATAILGAACGYLSLWLVYWGFKLLTGKEGMGYGDFKLFAALGAWMGWAALLPIILIASLVGAVVGGSLLALRGQSRAVPIPFGPFLAAAGWIWFIAGDWLLGIYFSAIGLAAG
ncbi:MAG TPA: A24 family peptidase [Rhodanobacteraceae bacterium]|nr:A24 family peptidase [Rhodanobacteraceae bacterium]